MLPEKKRNLIILGVSILVLIIIVLSIAFLSSWMKNRNKNNEGRDDAYPKEYEYYGILKDSDDVYKVYGITSNEEVYLGIRTFYEVTDAKMINNHLVFYSDAANELRYNKKKNTFNQYELDSYYNNNYKVRITDKYLVYTNKNEIYYKAFNNSEEKIKIADNLINDNIIITSDNIYFLASDGVYEYTFGGSTNKVLDTNGAELQMLAKNKRYLYFYRNNVLIVYDIKDKDEINIELRARNSKFIATWSEGFFYQDSENIIRKYSLDIGQSLIYEYPLEDNEVDNYRVIADDLLLVTRINDSKEYSLIINTKEEKIERVLDNNYIYLVKVN